VEAVVIGLSWKIICFVLSASSCTTTLSSVKGWPPPPPQPVQTPLISTSWKKALNLSAPLPIAAPSSTSGNRLKSKKTVPK
jgi:hypothetical protein